MNAPDPLERFFAPRSIAVVGASEQGLYSAGVIRNLLDYSFPGPIYPVNPNRSSVFGQVCYPDLAHLPARPDLVVLVVNRERVLPALQQCAQAGVPAALVFTAGFAEADETGAGLQRELAALAHSAGISLVGPNCAGLANIPGRVIATRLPAPPRPGRISFVSGSGALMMALYGLFVDRCLGMNRLLSVGNQAGVTLSAGLQHFAADPGTGVIAAFVEGLQDGQRFAAGLQAALLAGKPVVLTKSGRTAAGQQAAATHTAAVAGSARVFAAVCRQFGALLVDELDELLDTVQVLNAFGPWLESTPGPAGRGLLVVTQSGGMGALAADWCEREGFNLPPLSPALQARLAGLPQLQASLPLSNPADVRGPSLRGPGNTHSTLAPFLEDEASGAVLLLLARSAVLEADAETAGQIIAAAKESPKPLLVVWAGQRYPLSPGTAPLGHRMLVEAGIPLFSTTRDALRALARSRDYWQYRQAYLEQEG